MNFVKLVEKLRPGYKLPSRKMVAGPLLTAVYNVEFARVVKHTAGKRGTLMLDGWSTGHRGDFACSFIWMSLLNLPLLPNNEPVIAVSVAVGADSFLVGTEDTTGVPHTAAYLQQVASEYYDKVTTDMQITIVSITTDSASNMCKMREEFVKSHDNVFAIPCQAHWLHLLAKDLVPESEMLTRIVGILTWFHRAHAAHAGLLNRGLGKPPVSAVLLCFFLQQRARQHWPCFPAT